MRPWILRETNYGEVKQHHYDVAVLPMGATEPHNLHLPYGTDTYQVEALGERACEVAYRAGQRVVLLPAIPYGTETNLAKFPLAMNVNPSTLLALVRDLAGTLAASGVHKLVLLNGHGGNDFKPLLRELQPQTPVKLFLCDWFRGLSSDLARAEFRDPGDHAGALETAFILAIHPELVVREEATGGLRADEGAARETRLDGINRGWVSISRPWHLLTTNTGCGNPHEATAEKGQRILDGMVERLASFLVELAAAELDDQFPY
jgi:creatinine amidohydrolase